MLKKQFLTLILALFPLLLLLLTACAQQPLEARQIASSPTMLTPIDIDVPLPTITESQATPTAQKPTVTPTQRAKATYTSTSSPTVTLTATKVLAPEQANLLVYTEKGACLVKIGFTERYCLPHEVNSTLLWSADGERIFLGEANKLLVFDVQKGQTDVLWEADKDSHVEPIMSSQGEEILLRVYEATNKVDKNNYGQLWRISEGSVVELAKAPSNFPLLQLSRHWPHAFFWCRHQSICHVNGITGEQEPSYGASFGASRISLDGQTLAFAHYSNGRYSHPFYSILSVENLEDLNYLSNGNQWGLVWTSVDTFYYLHEEFIPSPDAPYKKKASVRLRSAQVGEDNTVTANTVATFPFLARGLLVSADKKRLFVAETPEGADRNQTQWWEVSLDGQTQQRVARTPLTDSGSFFGYGVSAELLWHDLLALGNELYHLRNGEKVALPEQSEEISTFLPRPKATFPLVPSLPSTPKRRTFPDADAFVVQDGDLYLRQDEPNYIRLSAGKGAVKKHFYDQNQQRVLYQEEERLRLASADGTSEDLTHLLPSDSHPFSLTYNGFSPDGRYFFLHSWVKPSDEQESRHYQTTDYKMTTWLLDLQSKTARRLRAEGRHASQGRWFSPQRLMLYESSESLGYQSVLLDVATGESRILPLGEPDPTWTILVELPSSNTSDSF